VKKTGIKQHSGFMIMMIKWKASEWVTYVTQYRMLDVSEYKKIPQIFNFNYPVYWLLCQRGCNLKFCN